MKWWLMEVNGLRVYFVGMYIYLLCACVCVCVCRYVKKTQSKKETDRNTQTPSSIRPFKLFGSVLQYFSVILWPNLVLHGLFHSEEWENYYTMRFASRLKDYDWPWLLLKQSNDKIRKKSFWFNFKTIIGSSRRCQETTANDCATMSVLLLVDLLNKLTDYRLLSLS